MKTIKTVKEGLKRSVSVNVTEQSKDRELNDHAAKLIKIVVRAAIAIIVFRILPEEYIQAALTFIFGF